MIHTNFKRPMVPTSRLIVPNANIRRAEHGLRNYRRFQKVVRAIAAMNSIIEWSSVEENPVLESGEIHVWRAFLSVDQSLLRHLESMLAEDERRARLDSFLTAIEITLSRREEFFAPCLPVTSGVRPKRSNLRTVRVASPLWPIQFQTRIYALIFRTHTVSR